MPEPAHQPPRRITLHKAPYNFEHSRSSVTCYSEPGEFLVPARVADDAVAKGYATEGWAGDSMTRTSKGGGRRKKRATSQRKSATAKPDAGAVLGSDDGMGGTGVPAPDRPGLGQPLADSAE